LTKYIIILQVKTKEMEDQQKFDTLLIPEAIERINSYNEIDTVRDDFKELLRSFEEYKYQTYAQNQLHTLTVMENYYRDIKQELEKSVNNKKTSFRYYCPDYFIRVNLLEKRTEKEILENFRALRNFHWRIYDCFIKHLSKINMYKNPKLTAEKVNHFWCVCITCDIINDIEYP
jgi:hypothetical protein